MPSDNPASVKKVSIVIPTFNQSPYLPACVDHCLFQTYTNLELIIVDGGSTDRTKDYLSGLREEISERSLSPVLDMDDGGNVIREKIRVYPEGRDVKIISFKQDLRPTRTYNEGLSRATGAYCTYVVGDDLPGPHMIEELVEALESTGADFVYSDMNVVQDDGKIVRQMRLPDYSFEACFARWYHLGVSHLYRTEWHERVGLMDERYQGANDYDHYLRFAIAGAKFHHLPRILYSIRYHGDDRKTGQHALGRYDRLIEESKQCAFRAREWLNKKGEGVA